MAKMIGVAKKGAKKVFAAKAVALPNGQKELRSVYRPKRKASLAR